MIINPLFKKIIQILENIPGLGQRQAIRIFFWLIKQDDNFKKRFLEIFSVAFKEIKLCKNCFFPSLENLCEICSDKKRRDDILMIVARETDVLSIETARAFNGKYFILGGLLLPFEEKKEIEERLKVLNEKLSQNNFQEIIIGLPFTREAEPTKKRLEQILKKIKNLQVSYLGRGVPFGGEIEFADPDTIKESLKNREKLL